MKVMFLKIKFWRRVVFKVEGFGVCDMKWSIGCKCDFGLVVNVLIVGGFCLGL